MILNRLSPVFYLNRKRRETLCRNFLQRNSDPGEKWSGLIGKNKYIHFKALGDNANVSILLYNMRDTSERYNMPDTLKAQYTAHLTKGNVLMSDNGRVLASITEDSLGWHDSISRSHNKKDDR